MVTGTNQEFFALLDFLKRNRGFDFTGYKQASLVRRVNKRMQLVGVDNYVDYIDYLELHPDEFVLLFNTILINVTDFFRDASAWEKLRAEIIPAIIDGKDDGEFIRIWTTGCASGEEAYTIAMLMAEALGEDQFRDTVKIYATDVDDEALSKARLAVYSEKDVQSIPPDLLQKYFVRVNGSYSFVKELRRNLIFGRNDLVQDAPISRIDLLVCRNTLMYFNAETQAKILARFHFAMKETGFLFLGKAEMLLTHANTFSPVDVKLRIFSKVPRANLREKFTFSNPNNHDDGFNQLFSMVRIRDAVFDAGGVAQVVVDTNNTLVMSNSRARELFNISTKDLGRPFQDLEISFRPVELRTSMQRANTQRAPVVLKDVEWFTGAGGSNFYEVRVQPLLDSVSNLLGVSISFTDVTQYRLLQRQQEQTNHELETALEELQSTNEELETTNEELQSTIEELETTNEELQSTNEELETINEEIQSTNEELQTINDELRQRTQELNQVNAFLESILTSVRFGVIVIDREMRVQNWNRLSEDLWGLRSSEVYARNFLSLDIGLPVDRLRRPLMDLLTKDVDVEDITLAAINRRGKEIRCRVSMSPLWSKDHQVEGAIILAEEVNHV